MRFLCSGDVVTIHSSRNFPRKVLAAAVIGFTLTGILRAHCHPQRGGGRSIRLKCIRIHFYVPTHGNARLPLGWCWSHVFFRIGGKLRPRLGRVGRRVGCGTRIDGVGCVSRRRLSPILVLT
ncbi:hypothetical protein TcCL_NonESM09457 [Trypanosoma cruzi]|nr:hypothetical protein TcCL_NonESM09457 [Trypanosoma cruzi]